MILMAHPKVPISPFIVHKPLLRFDIVLGIVSKIIARKSLSSWVHEEQMLPHTVYGELSYNLALEKAWVCTSRLYVGPKFSIYHQYPDRCGLKKGA